jgi:mono/diheme cytochrome c family protein
MLAMRFKGLAAIVLTAWAAGILQSARAEQAAPTGSGTASGSTWAGVYTEAQAKAGQAAYAKHCAECHGEALDGDGFAPSLKGPEFLNNWNGLTVGELFERIRVSMPPSDPHSVRAEDKVLIVAYVLQQSGFPAGKTELPTGADGLKAIKFQATKPGN